MNKQISTSLSIIVILILAISVSFYVIIKNHKTNYTTNSSVLAIKDFAKKSSPTCKMRAFTGSTKVSVWKTEKNGESVLQIIKEDTSKLPVNDRDSFILVDPTPEITKSLDTSSEEKPVEIDISGFVEKCDGTALACVSYRDGIFKPFI